MAEPTEFEVFKYSIQDQIDFMVDKFQVFIKKIEGLEPKLMESEKKSDQIISKTLDLEKKLSSIESFYSEFKNKYEADSSIIDKKFDSSVNINSDIYSILGTIKNDISNLSNNCVKNNDSLRDITPKVEACLIKSSDLEMVNSSYSKKFSESNDYAVSFEKKINILTDKVESYKKIYNDIMEKFEKNLCDINFLKKDFNEHVNKNSSFVTILNEKINTIPLDAIKYTDQKISEIPKPIVPSIEDAKKAFQSQIDPLSMDAKNAVLRTSNNESRINMIEKRIEQIQLLLQKHQLEG